MQTSLLEATGKELDKNVYELMHGLEMRTLGRHLCLIFAFYGHVL
jgi:hypothetical protein